MPEYCAFDAKALYFVLVFVYNKQTEKPFFSGKREEDMPKNVMRPQGEEVTFFHANYVYMWKKLNTAPYYVSGFGETPPWIREPLLLPSYVNLSKCMNPDFVPSLNIVNKIVQFYNANISPAVDTYMFLHERLEDTDRGRTALACSSPAPYCGLYYCYYYADTEDERQIRGALLYLFENGGELRVRMLFDLTEDGELCSEKLADMLRGSDLTPEKFADYKKDLPLNKKLILFFRGAGRIEPGVMTFRLQRSDRQGTYLTLFMPLSPAEGGQFIGSLGIFTLISEDRTFQFFRAGFERAGHPELRPLPLGEEKLKELLSLKKGANERIMMSLSDNRQWTNYLVFGSK